jgi:hypothetical protein
MLVIVVLYSMRRRRVGEEVVEALERERKVRSRRKTRR